MSAPRLTPRDLRVAHRTYRAGVPFGDSRTTIRACRATGLLYRYGFAMVEQESAWANVFGADGSAPYMHAHEPVTRARLDDLLYHVHRGYTSNGVGWTQLTYSGFLYEAEARGGAERPYVQCLVGFQALHDLMRLHGVWAGARAYNGTGPAADNYANALIARGTKWLRVMRGR